MRFFNGEIWEPEFTVIHEKTKEKVDPVAPSVVITKPGGDTETVAATKLEVGVYEAKIPLTGPGKWKAILKGSGTFTCVGPESITVEDP